MCGRRTLVVTANFSTLGDARPSYRTCSTMIPAILGYLRHASRVVVVFVVVFVVFVVVFVFVFLRDSEEHTSQL